MNRKSDTRGGRARKSDSCSRNQFYKDVIVGRGRLSEARRMTTIAAERRLPRMHWRWCRRGRDIEALLQCRLGSTLPNDDAGVDAVKLLAQHFMRLNIDAERITRANLRL